MKISIAALGAALLVAGWAGAAAADSFDLVCSGTMTRVYRYHRPSDPPKPFTTTVRIDADKARFCVDACRKSEPLVSIAGQSIRLRSAKLSGSMEGFADSFTVENGKMTRFTFYPTAEPHGLDHEFNLDQYEGSCTRAPFKGLNG